MMTVTSKHNSTVRRLLAASLFFLIACLPAELLAQDNPGARAAAAAFFTGEAKAAETGSLIHCYSSPAGVATPVYIYQNDAGGFVLIAQSDKEFNVVGYAAEGSFSTDETPEAFRALVGSYEASRVPPETKYNSMKKGTVVVHPLLDQQLVSLNQYHHPEVGGCPTGCVATAMTMILCYYKWPATGTGSHCYNHPVYGQLCADFGNTTFDWNSMTPEDYELLSFQMAIAMEMNFCRSSTGSSPSSPNYPRVLQNYYGYHARTGTNKSYYLYNELDHSRPVYVELPGDPAHAVVIDGYDSDGFFHINFGWGGSHNGYYLMNSSDIIQIGPYNVGYTFGNNVAHAWYYSTHPLKTSPADSLALLAVQNSLNSTNGWDTNKPVITWPGVVVMNERVVELSLSGVDGTIPGEIGNLTALRSLNIRGKVDGPLPSSVSQLTELIELGIYASGGSLTGTLPAGLGGMVNLETLYMSGFPSGEIPAAIGNLTKLRYLNLSSANLTGEIPESIGNLTNLGFLYLGGNQLTGALPAGIGNLTNLQSLNLSKNQLSGSLPESIGNLINLHTLNLSDNQLSGSLPASIGNLSNMQYLHLDDNDISGTLPETIGGCSSLLQLQLQNNDLEGALPGGMGGMTRLQNLELQNNRITALPNAIGRLGSLTGINLENNQLTTFPDSIIYMAELTSFKAANNRITSLPDHFGSWPGLTYIDLSHNEITAFPEELCFLTKLWFIDLGNNRIKTFPRAMEMMPLVAEIRLDSNLIQDVVSPAHMSTQYAYFDLRHNYLIYKNIPQADSYATGVGEQRKIPFSVNTVKVSPGDTISIDIRDISPLGHPGNAYYWLEYPNKERAAYHAELEDFEEGPVLTLVVDEKVLNSRYYCKIFNDNVSSFTWEWLGSTYSTPVLRYLDSDTLTFALYSGDELLEESYPGSYIISSKEIPGGEITNEQVTLVSPFDTRGELVWQGSADGQQWHDISLGMEQELIRKNLVSVAGGELVLKPLSPGYYRCVLTEGTCDPMISDPVKVNPLGEMLFDEMVTVLEEPLTVAVDSIEVVVPAGLSDEPFRMTIIKVENPPAAADGTRMGSVYDVTLSLGSVFEYPLEIRLKNLDIATLEPEEIPAVQAVYYDDKQQRWIPFTEGGIALSDSTVAFYTTHLTKLGWWELHHGSYTHRFTRDKVDVIYRWGTGTGEEINFQGYEMGIKGYPVETWQTANTDPDLGGTPAVVQDIAEYMNQIIDKFDSLQLQPSGSRFTVYLSNTGSGSLGHITVGGYNRGYFTINSGLATLAEDLRQTLAHEYMHYTQGRYMPVLASNYFWAEANAPLSDRIVWKVEKHKVPESESHLKQAYRGVEGSKSIYDLLGEPWDAATFIPVAEKFTSNPADANVSSTFLHYMRSHREGARLDPVKMLKDYPTVWNMTSLWRTYLNNQVQEQLGTTVGEEYDDFVRYLLSGVNRGFTILNTKSGNPLSNIISNSGTDNSGTFAQRMVYSFGEDQVEPEVENISFSVPHLASRVLLLGNNTPDKVVVVNYTRTHEADGEYAVYHGSYDVETKTMEFVDISDSLSYSLLLDARTEKSAMEYQNTSFLLFVNRKCPSVLSMSSSFNAAFELKAFPVINIDDLAYANVTDQAIHNYSDGSKRSFIMVGRFDKFAPGHSYTFTLSDYKREKQMIGDSAYRVTVSFTEELQLDNGPDLPATINNEVKQQVIEYNFLAGRISIVQHNVNRSKWGENYNAITGAYDAQKLIKRIDETHQLVLKDVFLFQPREIEYMGAVMDFRTYSTAETQTVVEKMEHTLTSTTWDLNGEVTSSGSATYESTEFSGSDQTMILWVHYK